MLSSIRDCRLREYWEVWTRRIRRRWTPSTGRSTPGSARPSAPGRPNPATLASHRCFWAAPRRPPPWDWTKHSNSQTPHCRRTARRDPAPTVTGRGYDIDPTCNWDASIRLRDMEVAGVDVSIIFPSQADGFCTLGDVGFESALHRSVPPLHEQTTAPPGDGRLWWMGVLTMRGLPESIAQLEYWAKEDPPLRRHASPAGLPRRQDARQPGPLPTVTRRARSLNLPLWVHGGANRPPLTPWVPRAQRPLPRHRADNTR